MVSFSSILLAFTAAVSVCAAPVEVLESGMIEARSEASSLIQRSGTPSSTGTSGGYYYSFWTDGGAAVTYTNGALGAYTITWGTGGNFVGGKGWATGSAR